MISFRFTQNLLHWFVGVLIILWTAVGAGYGADLPPVLSVEGQPLAANIERLEQALDFLGTPLPERLRTALAEAGRQRDAARLQELLDPQILLVVRLNPEVRVKVERGPGAAVLQQNGYTPVLIKVINQSTGTQRLGISSPQSGPVYAGAAPSILTRQAQLHLRENENTTGRTDRFLEVEMFRQPPMTSHLSGLEVEYAMALIYCSEAGKREATIAFDAGQGSQDIGFRGETPVLFEVRPAVAVALRIYDENSQPTAGRFTFRDRAGHVFPPQAKRVAPDLFFQKQIYRHHGQTVLLPPGALTMEYGRGPEYRRVEQAVSIPSTNRHALEVKLERWIDPAAYGFYSGDHHIHASGCAHYTKPSEGVLPEEMFVQVKGEALNVGCVLTWGPGFDYQCQFFAPVKAVVSEPMTILKYDIEVSGFGSQALGHVCLLNLKEQIYPGAKGSQGWPTWTTPVLRWAKSQGAFTGYAHSGSGLEVEPERAGSRLVKAADGNGDGMLQEPEASTALLPEPFAILDANKDRVLSLTEVIASIDRAADRLPNLAIPELNSVGAQEIFVTTALGVCDFISAMNTARILEWNCWYHLLNCGFPLKVSGETDFPCMSGTRVGQGRVYVHLGKVESVDYGQWCTGLARGQSYISDGHAHALIFEVNGKRSGEKLDLAGPGTVRVKATVAFSAETPVEVAYGGAMPVGGARLMGDTKNLHAWAEPEGDALFRSGRRRIELVVNGRPQQEQIVPADGKLHTLEFQVPMAHSGWIALRQFPQLHTNPVEVNVGGRPIRASRQSALWAIECIDQLWRARANAIAPAEREEARTTFERVKGIYRKIAEEAVGE